MTDAIIFWLGKLAVEVITGALVFALLPCGAYLYVCLTERKKKDP